MNTSYSAAYKQDGTTWMAGRLAFFVLQKPIDTCIFINVKEFDSINFLKDIIRRDRNRYSWSLDQETIAALINELNHFIKPPSFFNFFVMGDKRQLIFARALKQYIEHKNDYRLIKTEIENYKAANSALELSADQARFNTCLKTMIDVIEDAKLQVDDGCKKQWQGIYGP